MSKEEDGIKQEVWEKKDLDKANTQLYYLHRKRDRILC